MKTLEDYTKAGFSPHSETNQKILRDFVNREIGHCVSSLVSHFASNMEALEGSGYSWEEDILPLCEYPPDWEEAAREEGWEEEDSTTLAGFIKTGEESCQDSFEALCSEQGIEFDLEEPGDAEEEATLEGWRELPDGGFTKVLDESMADDWQELCDEQEIEPDRCEVFEHWIVSDWLARKLAEHGEPTGELFDLAIWGRGCSGQAILLDYVIAEIAAEMGILEGQASDWSKQSAA